MATDLRAYSSRLVLSWMLETPDARHRALAGSMVFCDVSGFTALSERLARKGKVGAEELTEVLNAVFSGLLATAAEYGGSMLKYGGDAVLVFFWGDGHERRATKAAAAMRAVLRRSVTPIRLRMSVGIHSGDFDFFLVGESHRELVVTGPAATHTCAAEASAAAGEIVLSAATAAAVPSGCVDERGRLVRPPSVAAVELELPPSGDASGFVPVSLREHLLTGAEDASHRQVAVGFIAFSGVDALLAEEGAAAVGERVERLVATAQRCFAEHGVTFLATDISADGGKIIAVAGAPTSLGDNEERAVRAVAAVLCDYEGLNLRAGLHRGSVFAGDIGPVFRRTYTVLGDVVNTAARIMASAEPGQLRATADVLDRADTLFAATAQPAFVAKGKAQPLTTFAVGPPRGRREERYGRLPMFGRAAELGMLSQAAAEALAGAGALIEVVGEGGIGKTRLLHEWLGREPAIPSLNAACEQYENATPYFAARQLMLGALDLPTRPTGAELAAAVAAVRPDLLAWLPLIAMPLDVAVTPTPETTGLDPRFVKARLLAVVAELLAAAVSTPTNWVLEDAQWIDDASRDLLAAVFADLDARPWAVVMTRRPEDQPVLSGVVSTMIALRPLAREEAAGLARAAAPQGLLPPDAALIAERAAGHPLFVRELAQAFRSEETLDELPDSIDNVLTARIDSLDPSDRAALRVAAVLGASFGVGMLRQLAPDANLRALSAFVEVRGDQARFRQALFQQAAYDALPFRQRRVLHAAAARLLAAEADGASDEILSLHALEGQLYDAAWQYAVRAAGNAAERYAITEAITLYRRAVRAARQLDNLDPAEHAEAWTQLGRLLVRAGRLTEAKQAFGKARRLLGDVPRLLLNEGEVRAELGAPTQAIRWFTRGLRTATDDEWRIPLLAAIAKLRLAQGDLATGTSAARQAVALADATEREVKPVHVADVWSILAAASLMRGEPEAVEHSRRALTLYREAGERIGEGTVLSNLGTLAFNEGRIDDALSFYEQSRAAHTAAGASVFAALAANNIGEVLVLQGRDNEAEGVLSEALETFQASGSWYAAYPQRELAVIAARRGAADEARRLFSEARAKFESVGAESEVAATDEKATAAGIAMAEL